MSRRAWTDAAECTALWTSRIRVCVSELRHPPSRERRHRSAGHAGGRVDSRPRSAGRRGDDALATSPCWEGTTGKWRTCHTDARAVSRSREPDSRHGRRPRTQWRRPDRRSVVHRGARNRAWADCLGTPHWHSRWNGPPVARLRLRASGRIGSGLRQGHARSAARGHLGADSHPPVHAVRSFGHAFSGPGSGICRALHHFICC